MKNKRIKIEKGMIIVLFMLFLFPMAFAYESLNDAIIDIRENPDDWVLVYGVDSDPLLVEDFMNFFEVINSRIDMDVFFMDENYIVVGEPTPESSPVLWRAYKKHDFSERAVVQTVDNRVFIAGYGGDLNAISLMLERDYGSNLLDVPFVFVDSSSNIVDNSISCMSDSDGENYFKAGVVETVEDGSFNDFCDETVIFEYVCEDDKFGVVGLNCTTGCMNGHCVCPGDATEDGIVNAFDLAKLRQGDISADFNGDEIINAFDLAILRQNSGACSFEGLGEGRSELEWLWLLIAVVILFLVWVLSRKKKVKKKRKR